MFGFSFFKLAVLVAILAAVWYGFKYLGRRQELQNKKSEDSVRDGQRGKKGPAVEDMVQCPDCGAFVADDGRHRCG